MRTPNEKPTVRWKFDREFAWWTVEWGNGIWSAMTNTTLQDGRLEPILYDLAIKESIETIR